jgi:hypothetical protein
MPGAAAGAANPLRELPMRIGSREAGLEGVGELEIGDQR